MGGREGDQDRAALRSREPNHLTAVRTSSARATPRPTRESSLSLRTVAGLVILSLCALRTPALGQGLIWSDEIVVDPGIRAFTYYGFKSWLTFTLDSTDRNRVVATWSEEPEYGYETNVYLVDASGENDGRVRTRSGEDRISTLQVTRAWNSGWIALEAAPGEGLRVTRYGKLLSGLDRTVLLAGESMYDQLSVRLEPVADGYWIGWQSSSGDVRMARLTVDLELDGEVQTLAQSVDAMDIDFGPSGGVIGWLKLDEHRLYWAPLDDRGELLREPHMYPVVPQTPWLGLARCADRVLYTWPDEFRTVRVDGLEIESGDLLFQRTHSVVERECDLIAGVDGALLLSRAEALVIDTEGLTTQPPIALSPYAYENPNGPVALWVGDRYLMGWSNLAVKTGAQEQASASYCYVYNAAGSVTISPDGSSGPEHFLNAVWEPLFIQPWFVGNELHLQLGDHHTNKLYHVNVEHDGSVELLQSIGGSNPCDTWMHVRPGVVAGNRLVTYRNEHYTSRWGDVEYENSQVSVLGGSSAGIIDSEPRLGWSWGVAVIENAAWVVADLRPYDEPDHSVVYGPDRPPILLEPTPTDPRSRILEMSNQPYVLWQVEDTLFGGFVPEIAEDSIEPIALHTAPGLLLDAAVTGGRGGLVLFRSDGPTSGHRLSALMLRASGEVLDPPAAIADRTRLGDSHAAWDGERFIVAWQEPTAENSYDVKISRVTPSGSVLDAGGQTIATTDWNAQPLVAAAAPQLIAVGYGANRVRTVEDVTPIAASGPFAVSLPRGIEITWNVGAGDVDMVTVERARATSSEESQIFTTVLEDPSGRAASHFDSSVESGLRYAYRVRLRESSGEELVLGPVEIAWVLAGHERLLELTVHPNPTAGSLTLRLGADSAKPDRVEIIDVQGRIRAALPEGSLPDLAHSGSVSLNGAWAHLPSGTYWIRASAGSRSSSTRFQLLR